MHDLRVATPDDAAAVDRLLAASYGTLMPSHYPEDILAGALPLITRANPELLGSGTYYLVVEPDGTVIGAGGWSHARPGSGKTIRRLGHLRHFATDPDKLGRGVGRLIHDRCLAEVRAAGLTRLEVYASLNAEGFYAAMGFLPVARVAVPLRPGVVFPSVRMLRII